MTDAVAQILTSVGQLSEKERADLAYALVCSLEPGEESGVGEAWDLELARRIAEIQSGTAKGEDAAEVFQKLREHHR
ncbi:MAG TPA: addiction module protein [Pirellulales bacterium]|jgi:hypothetical protein|nr:addiction module protein [Pirellulales bacterium]